MGSLKERLCLLHKVLAPLDTNWAVILVKQDYTELTRNMNMIPCFEYETKIPHCPNGTHFRTCCSLKKKKKKKFEFDPKKRLKTYLFGESYDMNQKIINEQYKV